MSTPQIQAVLFDLDGTLVDTAPDLAYALNCMRVSRKLEVLPVAATRAYTSMGARGLLGVGLEVTPGHADYEAMREEFLGIYADNLCRESQLFAGMPELLDELEQRRLKWGVVTNKAERFTHPLLKLLGIHHRAACIIGGDTTGKTKPDPAPMFAATERMGIDPGHCIYVGDDRRDVQAGRAAGMKTIVAKFGYLHGNDPETWGADAMVDAPQDILKYL
jgi:N-acetyl-D-muramate 6-phosphate phosphatase